jgi:hypothetical protein
MKNRNWMVWAVIILAVMNISTIVTIFYNQKKENRNVTYTVPSEKNTDSDIEKFSGRFFRDRLNLDASQMDKFRQFNPGFRQNARDINVELSDKRNRMLSELASDKPDTNRLNSISDSIGRLHSELKQITCKYYLDIKCICDKEQNAQLELLFKEMFSNDNTLGQYGRGMQWGRQRKQMYNN